jgi:hypothetical protein
MERQMSDDDNKIVDLKAHKRVKHNKVDDLTMRKTWRALANVWDTYATDVGSRQVPGELNLSDAASAVFSVLIEQLVSMAKVMEIENDEILEMLLTLAILECEPKGRLYELINKAANLLEYGDEDAWEKMLRKMHAEGRLTDEQLATELKIPV